MEDFNFMVLKIVHQIVLSSLWKFVFIFQGSTNLILVFNLVLVWKQVLSVNKEMCDIMVNL